MSRASQSLTLEELRFLRTEIYSALSCGAEDRMFEQVHAKLEAIILARGGNPMKREFKPDSQSDAKVAAEREV